MQIKVMAGQEKMANGSEKGVILHITFQSGKKSGFNGLVDAVELLQKKLQPLEMQFLLSNSFETP